MTQGTESARVEPEMVDREAARVAAFALGVPDISGPRQQQILAEVFARQRLAAIEVTTEAAAKYVAEYRTGTNPDVISYAIRRNCHLEPRHD